MTAGSTGPIVASFPALEKARRRGVEGPRRLGVRPTALMTTVFCTGKNLQMFNEFYAAASMSALIPQATASHFSKSLLDRYFFLHRQVRIAHPDDQWLAQTFSKIIPHHAERCDGAGVVPTPVAHDK